MTTVGGGDSSGGRTPAAGEHAAADRDPHGGVAVGTAEALGREERLDPGRQRLAEIVGESDLQPARRATEPVDVLRELGRAPAVARSVSKTPSPSWKPRSNAERCGESAGSSRPSTQTVRGPVTGGPDVPRPRWR